MIQQVHIHSSRTDESWWRDKSPAKMRDELRSYNVIIPPCGTTILNYDARNAGGFLHVCLVPVRTITETKRFADYYTKLQRIALRDYIFWLEQKLGTRHLMIGNHGDTSPGFKVFSTEWM